MSDVYGISCCCGRSDLLLLYTAEAEQRNAGNTDYTCDDRAGSTMEKVKETVYLKAEQSVEVTTRDVYLKDIASLECPNTNLLCRLKTLKILKIPDEGKHRYVVSVLKLIELIHQEYPNLQIQNLGAPDVIITYEEQSKNSKLLQALKVIGIGMIVFVGGAYSIMSFNNDTNAPELFAQIYRLFMGKEQTGFSVLEATYCIGMAIGILAFFNHFGKRKIAVDPTPLEVEMRLYENDIQTTLIQTYTRKGKEADVD